MTSAASLQAAPSKRATTDDPRWVKAVAIGIALAFVLVILVMPLCLVFAAALKDGVRAFFASITSADTISALELSLLTVAVVVPLNVVFGVAAAWAIGRFRFRGRSVLITLLDVPLAVSPVIAGMCFVLVFGDHGLFGPLLEKLDVDVIFAPPGIILATAFVTFPFVARELIPFWESQGSEEEEAALVLGASAVTMFRRISLPNARWALLYGIVLTASRALGEFGAVSVVSGHIRGQTNTLPLQVEVLYGDYHYSAAFAVASLLVMTGLVSLVAKRLLERRLEQAKRGR